MSAIRKKIELFKSEAGEKEQYNIEQQKIYSAFTKENGKGIRFAVTDCEGKIFKVTLDSATEVRKILLKHYQEPNGTVTVLPLTSLHCSGPLSCTYGHHRKQSGNQSLQSQPKNPRAE